MIKNVLNKVVNTVKNSAESTGRSFVCKINNDFARSPKADCCVFTNPIKAPKILIEEEQAWEDKIAYTLSMIEGENFPKHKLDFFQSLLRQKSPDGTPRFDTSTALDFIRLKDKDYQRVVKFIECKNPEGGFRFDRYELAALSQLKGKRYSNAEKLLEIKVLDADLLIKLSSKKLDFKKLDKVVLAENSLDNKLSFCEKGIASILTPGGIDIDKLLPRFKDKLAREKDNLSKILLEKPVTSSGDYVVRYSFKNGGAEELSFDKAGKKLNHVKTEMNFSESGEKIYTKKDYDFKKDSYSIIKYVKRGEHPLIKNETRILRDKSGNVIRKEILTPSQVEGIYNVKSIDAKGNVKILSSGEKDKKGCVTVKKNLESLDGTKTQYEYYDDPVGNRITYYKIVDNKGKVLLNDTQSFEVVDKNTAISSHRGNSYEIKTDKAGMKIRNLQTGEMTEIDFNKTLAQDNVELKELLSKVSAEELIVLNKKGIKLNYVKNALSSNVNYDRTVSVGKNMFVFEHEAGHVKDIRHFVEKDIRKERFVAGDKNLAKIYNAERKAFMAAFPNAQQSHVDYFVDKTYHYAGADGGLMEAVAETNGVLNAYQCSEQLAIRTNYLQQYFPRTIAKAAELLSGK